MNSKIRAFLDQPHEAVPDSVYGPGVRCSAYLMDGTYLPCVMLRQTAPVLSLALRRFDDERKGKGMFSKGDGYERIVCSFVASGNRVNEYDIAKVEPSTYAIPMRLRDELEGETSMSWTGFVLETHKQLLAFGTTFLAEFFNIPDDFSFDDVVAVHNHSYVTTSGKLRSLERGLAPFPTEYNAGGVYRERQYFTCNYDA